MGSNFNVKFRMIGPWKLEKESESIMRNELYNVVKRSGGWVYLATYTLVPFFIFGVMSMVLYAWDGICDCFAACFGRRSQSTKDLSQD
ncbi:hypothetical protein FAVG1_11196 [Fusarium avenaceum]|nr:hypothetical protein FAVG1_11196 [Fusarium avenaceum]